MIFQRALLREFASFAGAVFMTLFVIALTVNLVRLLGRAAGGQFPSDAVVAFLGFFALGVLPVLLSLTMFISVLMTLTRSWRDSEMVIWFSSGLSLASWLKPVMLFALPQITLIAVLSLVISPWAAQMARQYAQRLESRDDVVSIPGVPPRLDAPFRGCPFAPRCDLATELCSGERPELKVVGDAHVSACHYASSLEVVS